MTDPVANPLLDPLKARLSTLSEKVKLADITSSVENLERTLTYHQQAIKRLTDGRYSRTDALSAILQSVESTWHGIKATFDRHLAANKSAVEAVQARAAALLAAAEQTGRQDISAQATAELADLENRLSAAENGLGAQVKPLNDALADLGNQLAVLEWSAKKWADFPDALAGESLLIAAEAEWLLTGDDKQDPDGTLYLTDQRLVFERDEKTGKLLGMFGGKKQKETGFIASLAQIASVEAEDARKGMGTEDRIHLTLTGDAERQQTSFELKGRSSNEAWVEMLGKVRSGQSIFKAPHLSLPPLDDSALPAPVEPLKLFDDIGAAAGNLSSAVRDALSSATAKSAMMGGGMAAAMGALKKDDPVSDSPAKKEPAPGGMMKDAMKPTEGKGDQQGHSPMGAAPAGGNVGNAGRASAGPMGGKGQEEGDGKGAEGHTPLGPKSPNAPSGGMKKDAE